MAQPRATFSPDELAIVLSHYDLGIVSDVREFPRGSHQAPKVMITSNRGRFLLKRRPRGKDDPFKVAFSHELQNYLAEQSFPLPHLVGTRETNNSMLKIEDAIYEVFEFIDGQNYDGGLLPTYESGKTLGLYHRLIQDFRSNWKPPPGHYHASRGVLDAFPRMEHSLARRANATESASQRSTLMRDLRAAYATAADRVNRLGFAEWPTQIVHSDWHPGNMIFDKGHVVAVIDFAAARIAPRVVDLANGCLQFSFIAGGKALDKWEDRTDVARATRFLRGYDERNVVSELELQAIPPLMQEAIIAQAVAPIIKTGTFAGLDGFAFLSVMRNKMRWIEDNAPQFELDAKDK
jgi:homoserine kinase type II